MIKMASLESPNKDIMNAAILESIFTNTDIDEKGLALIARWQQHKHLTPEEFLYLLNQLNLRLIKFK